MVSLIKRFGAQKKSANADFWFLHRKLKCKIKHPIYIVAPAQLCLRKKSAYGCLMGYLLRFFPSINRECFIYLRGEWIVTLVAPPLLGCAFLPCPCFCGGCWFAFFPLPMVCSCRSVALSLRSGCRPFFADEFFYMFCLSVALPRAPFGVCPRFPAVCLFSVMLSAIA